MVSYTKRDLFRRSTFHHECISILLDPLSHLDNLEVLNPGLGVHLGLGRFDLIATGASSDSCLIFEMT